MDQANNTEHTEADDIMQTEEVQEKVKKVQSRRESEAELIEDENQYVTFVIGEETYGVEVLRVQEIIGMVGITHVPNTMEFMKGVINLRGMVVPVIDMRIKFSMTEKDYDAFTVIIIVEVRGRMIGMIVDSVSDVVNIPIKSIQETPHFSSKIETDFIDGIGQIDEKLVIILDVDKILTSEEVKNLSEQSNNKTVK